MSAAVVSAATLALAGCVPASAPPPRPAPNFTPATRPSQEPQYPLQVQPTVSGVIGADAKSLIRLLGEPRLDIRDPAARKLQFSDGRCVLDAYLYPPRPRREPVVTYAEARTTDGNAMDWQTCASQLKAH